MSSHYRAATASCMPDVGTALKLSDTVDELLHRERGVVSWALERRDAEQHARARRLATLGQMTATIGHELRNPLGVIESSAFILRRKLPAEPTLTRHLERVSRQVAACHRIVEDLLHLARDTPARLESLGVREAFEQALEEAQLDSGIQIQFSLTERVRAHADAGLLQRALVNLLRNAGQVLGNEGRVLLEARVTSTEMVLSVQDTGPGFPPAVLGSVFEPLVTTRAEGTGLGLALVHSVMLRHGGSARAHNPREGGARVQLHFPTPASKGPDACD